MNLATIKIVCAWCKKEMGIKIPRSKEDAGMVTHGICKECTKELITLSENEIAQTLRKLDKK